jgi:hypothetical protein
VTEQLYSAVADAQLDLLEVGPRADLYDAVVSTCMQVFDEPALAQSLSTVIATERGLVLVLPVPRHPPYKVFWTSAGPRIEAVFPRP